jgi:hypothetical protein
VHHLRVDDTDGKLTIAVVDSGGKFTSGVNDTGGHIFSEIYFDRVSVAANFPPVSPTPVVRTNNISRHLSFSKTEKLDFT